MTHQLAAGAVVCASVCWFFSFLSSLVAQVAKVLVRDTLDRLPRHRGHFYNWYDTQTGVGLLPLYVSTVDSGNLSGHLLAVAQACHELATDERQDATPAERATLQALALLRKQHPQAQLYIVGDGPDRELLARQAG